MPQWYCRMARVEDIERLKNLDSWPPEEIWRSKITRDEVVVLTDGEDGEVVGCACYSVLWTTVPFLGLIVIDQGHRGEGGSRHLLSFLKEKLKSMGFVALLSSSQTDEPEPQKWHTHMGFARNGLIEHIAGEGIGEIVYRVML